MAAVEATQTLQKFCQWWKNQSQFPDLASLAMSGLPKVVVGQKGGNARRSRRGRSSNRTTPTPTRTYNCTSCVTGLPANATFHMNFGYMSQSSVSDIPQSSVVSQSSVGYMPQFPISSNPSQLYSPHGVQSYV